MMYKMRLQTKRRRALELRRRFDAYQSLASLLTLSLFFNLASAASPRRAGGSFGLFQQSPQQSRDKASGGGDEKEVRALEAGTGRSVEAGATGDAQGHESAASLLPGEFHPIRRVGGSGGQAMK